MGKRVFFGPEEREWLLGIIKINNGKLTPKSIKKITLAQSFHERFGRPISPIALYYHVLSLQGRLGSRGKNGGSKALKTGKSKENDLSLSILITEAKLTGFTSIREVQDFVNKYNIADKVKIYKEEILNI